MAKKINEYDYLYISARIHAMENRLLTRERMERPDVPGQPKTAERVIYEQLKAEL